MRIATATAGARRAPSPTPARVFPAHYTIGESGAACATRACRGNIMRRQARVISFDETEEVRRTHRFSQTAWWMTVLLLPSVGGVGFRQSHSHTLVDEVATA